MNWSETRARLEAYGIVGLPEEWQPGINLIGVDLHGADLRGANLANAKLANANLTSADLSDANLDFANLRLANLCRASLCGASLIGADLRNAALYATLWDGANLYGADFSGAHGLLDPSEWLSNALEHDDDGYICYKRIGKAPDGLVFFPGEYIIEAVNPDRSTDFGHSATVGTWQWCKEYNTEAVLWRCLIEWRYLPSVIVPFNTNGNFRAGRVKLLEIVPEKSK